MQRFVAATKTDTYFICLRDDPEFKTLIGETSGEFSNISAVVQTIKSAYGKPDSKPKQ
jgi:hypothetical protein